jgi:7tm Chemosensory receptor
MFLFRFFGLSLLSAGANGMKMKCHLALRLVNCSWIVVNLAVFAFLVVSPSSKLFSRNYSDMSEIIEIANYILALLTMFIILMHVQLALGKELIWHRKLSELDRLLAREQFSATINHEIITRWRLWKVLIALTASGVCSAINIFYATRRNNDSVPHFLVHNYILKSVINLRYAQNLTRIDCVRHRIAVVREAILEVAERNTLEWKIVLVVDKLNRQHLNPLGRKIDDAKDILLFKRFYATLFELMKLMENCFGWSLLAMISFTFVDLTSNLYWLFIAVLNLDQRMQATDCIIEIVPSVLVISCLVHSSFDVSRKAKEVINAISTLSTNTTSCYNAMTKELLLQAHHERIENSANDFFIVDFELLSSVSKAPRELMQAASRVQARK